MLVRIDWAHPQSEAWKQLRTQPGIVAELDRRANAILAACGPKAGYAVRPAYATGGKVRGRAEVVANGFPAIADNAKNHTLMKALGAGKN